MGVIHLCNNHKMDLLVVYTFKKGVQNNILSKKMIKIKFLFNRGIKMIF